MIYYTIIRNGNDFGMQISHSDQTAEKFLAEAQRRQFIKLTGLFYEDGDKSKKQQRLDEWANCYDHHDWFKITESMKDRIKAFLKQMKRIEFAE
jgi:hypothetical protein